VTSDLRPDEVGLRAHSSARTQPTARTRPVAGNGARPAKDTTPAGNRAITTGAESGTLVLRSGTPPVDQLDFDDRHDTRATESDELARRYTDLRKDRRRDDWHKLVMGLVGFATLAVLYIVGFIVVLRLLPHLGPSLAAKIVGLAFIAAGGGVAVRSAGQVLKHRTAPEQDRSSKPT
jgi:hypothetical protein